MRVIREGRISRIRDAGLRLVYAAAQKSSPALGLINQYIAAAPVIAASIQAISFPLVLGTCWERDVRSFLRDEINKAATSQLKPRIDEDDLKSMAKRIAGSRLRNFEIDGGTWDRITENEIDSALGRIETSAEISRRAWADAKVSQSNAAERARQAALAVQETEEAEEMRIAAEEAREAAEELNQANLMLQDAIRGLKADQSALKKARDRARELRGRIADKARAAVDSAGDSVMQKLDQAVAEAVRDVESKLPIGSFIAAATSELTDLITDFTLKVSELTASDPRFQTAMVDTHEMGETMIDTLLMHIRDNKGKISPGGMALALVDQLVNREVFIEEDKGAIGQLLAESRILGLMNAWWQKYSEAIQIVVYAKEERSSAEGARSVMAADSGLSAKAIRHERD